MTSSRGAIGGAGAIPVLLWMLMCFILMLAKRAESLNCTALKCGELDIPYPFSIDGCSSRVDVGNFSLKCNNNKTLYLPLNTKQYKVINFTDMTIIVDPLAETLCNETNFQTFNLTGMKSFWASPRNTLAVWSCGKNSSSSSSSCEQQCPFPLHVKVNNTACHTSDACCYDLHADVNVSSLWKSGNRKIGNNSALTSQCNTFSSWVVVSQNGTDNGVEIDARYGLELDWSIPMQCPQLCAHNANCTADRSNNGNTCKCLGNFQGDGYLNGTGCSPVPKPVCNATVQTNCTCHTSMKDGICETSHSGSSLSLWSLISAGIGAGVLVVGIVFFVFLCVRCQSTRSKARLRRRETQELARLFSLGKGINTTTFFTYKELEKATKGFSIDKRIGGGAFGTVFAGKLQDGTLIAVKVINARNMQGIEQVVNEVTALSSVNHTNLVQLLGCCLESRDPLLVYEFVENGTLTEHLQQERGHFLDWDQRMRIATETAGALAYLHSAISPPIYHRDVKTSNILLDANFNTKVADFGLSRTILTEGSHVSTVPQGTPGYLDPEYHQYFHLSDKSDVYSFGVVLIEIITAMKVVDFSREQREVNLAAFALSKITSGHLRDIIDPSLEVEKNPAVNAMVHRVAELAFRCLASDKDSRPTMLEVANELALIHLASIDYTPDTQLFDLPLNKTHDPDDRKGAKPEVVSPNSVHQPWSSLNTSPSDSVITD